MKLTYVQANSILQEWAKEKWVSFVTKSYGSYTAATVNRDDLIDLIQKAIEKTVPEQPKKRARSRSMIADNDYKLDWRDLVLGVVRRQTHPIGFQLNVRTKGDLRIRVMTHDHTCSLNDAVQELSNLNLSAQVRDGGGHSDLVCVIPAERLKTMPPILLS